MGPSAKPTDDGGFRTRQQKTGGKIGDIWCPIEEPLAAEMATWDRGRLPGPYLRQNHGKVYSRALLDKHFLEARDSIPELAGATFHGLRATRVVDLRQRGATTLQIQIGSVVAAGHTDPGLFAMDACGRASSSGAKLGSIDPTAGARQHRRVEALNQSTFLGRFPRAPPDPQGGGKPCPTSRRSAIRRRAML